jgi:hypothetical protein
MHVQFLVVWNYLAGRRTKSGEEHSLTQKAFHHPELSQRRMVQDFWPQFGSLSGGEFQYGASVLRVPILALM